MTGQQNIKTHGLCTGGRLLAQTLRVFIIIIIVIIIFDTIMIIIIIVVIVVRSC
jgi:hypothetical protein